jgi:hypothetical protein
MTFCSKLVAGAILTLSSISTWSTSQAQQPAVAREQPPLAMIWHEDNAAELVSGYQGEIN